MALGMSIMHWMVLSPPSSTLRICCCTASSAASSAFGTHFWMIQSQALQPQQPVPCLRPLAPPHVEEECAEAGRLARRFIVLVVMLMGSANPAATTASLISSLVTLSGATPHTPVAETVLMHCVAW